MEKDINIPVKRIYKLELDADEVSTISRVMANFATWAEANPILQSIGRQIKMQNEEFERIKDAVKKRTEEAVKAEEILNARAEELDKKKGRGKK